MKDYSYLYSRFSNELEGELIVPPRPVAVLDSTGTIGTGVALARDRRYTFVVFMDGDGEDPGWYIGGVVSLTT